MAAVATLGMFAPALIQPLLTVAQPTLPFAAASAGAAGRIADALRSPDAAINLEGRVGNFLASRGLLADFNVRIGGRQIDAIAGKAGECVVEITAGRGGGKLAQAAKQAEVTGKQVIVYGERLTSAWVREAQRQGIRVAAPSKSSKQFCEGSDENIGVFTARRVETDELVTFLQAIGARDATPWTNGKGAEEWVGIGARLIRNRSGQVVGKLSADGQRVSRTTRLNKAQPYIHLENKATGGNLHVRW